MWSSFLTCLLLVLSVNAYSKYGRTCKDIGCLNSETCIIVEDPCSYGRTSDCGTYPTCKKKTASDSETHNIPVTKATTPKPIADLKPQPPRFDDVPNYPPPAPPRGGSFGNTNGGSYPYGNTNGGSNPYGSNPYGNTGGGGSNPYGTIGGSGRNPYGSNGGGGSNPYGSNTGGGSNPIGGSSSGGSNPFGNFNFGSIFGNNGGAGGSSGNKEGGSNPFGTIFSGILSNFTKNLPNIPGFNPGMTRPGLIDNRNSNPNPYGNTYSSSGSYYPSYNQPSNTQGQPTQQNGYIANNYGARPANDYSYKNAATTAKPSFFKKILGFTFLCVGLHIFIRESI